MSKLLFLTLWDATLTRCSLCPGPSEGWLLGFIFTLSSPSLYSERQNSLTKGPALSEDQQKTAGSFIPRICRPKMPHLQQREGCLSSMMQILQPYSTGLICRELAWYRLQFKTAFLDHNTSQDRTRAKALCPCGESKERTSSRRRWVPLPLMHSKQVHKLPHVFQGLTWPFSSQWLAVSSPAEAGVPWFDCIKNKHSLRIECLQN